jgi:hypothetical protein
VEELCDPAAAQVALGRVPARRRSRLWLGLIPAAAAACVALWLALPGVGLRQDRGQWPADGEIADRPATTLTPVDADFLGDPPASRLANWSGPAPSRERGTRVNYYGVLDESREKLYLLEIKRTTTTERNRRRPLITDNGRVVLSSGEM